jgi:hypothetical protein
MSYTSQSKINIEGTQAAKVQVPHGANRDKKTRKIATVAQQHHCTSLVPTEGSMNIQSQRQKGNQVKTKKHKCLSQHSEVPH